MKAFAIVISGLLLAAPALAQANDGAEGNSEQPRTEQPRAERDAEAGEGSERRICRRVEDNTGSLTAGRRVCMTAQQWRNYYRRD